MKHAVEFKAVGGGKIYVDPLAVDAVFNDVFVQQKQTPSGPSLSHKDVVTIACNGFAVMAIDVKIEVARKMIADAQEKALTINKLSKKKPE